MHELSAARDQFRHRWSSHEVVSTGGRAQSFRHPAVGALSADLMQLRMLDRPSLKLIIDHPSSEENLHNLDMIRCAARWDTQVSS